MEIYYNVIQALVVIFLFCILIEYCIELIKIRFERKNFEALVRFLNDVESEDENE